MVWSGAVVWRGRTFVICPRLSQRYSVYHPCTGDTQQSSGYFAFLLFHSFLTSCLCFLLLSVFPYFWLVFIHIDLYCMYLFSLFHRLIIYFLWLFIDIFIHTCFFSSLWFSHIFNNYSRLNFTHYLLQIVLQHMMIFLKTDGNATLFLSSPKISSPY